MAHNSLDWCALSPTGRGSSLSYERSPSGREEGLAGPAVARRGLILLHCTALVQVAAVALIIVIMTTAGGRLIMVINQ